MAEPTLLFAAEAHDEGGTTFSINPDALTTPYEAGVTLYYLQKQLALALQHFGKAQTVPEAMLELTRGMSDTMASDKGDP